MNAEIRRILAVSAVILAVVPFALGQPASASEKCKQVKGAWFDGVAGSAYTGQSGTITQGGVLNGSTVVIYDPAFVVTPNQNFVAYISELAITTNRGQLRASVVYLYDIVTNDLWTAIGYINPNSSTGKFAGATGVLYFNGKTLGTYPLAVYTSDIAGQICFASGSDNGQERDEAMSTFRDPNAGGSGSAGFEARNSALIPRRSGTIDAYTNVTLRWYRPLIRKRFHAQLPDVCGNGTFPTLACVS